MKPWVHMHSCLCSLLTGDWIWHTVNQRKKEPMSYRLNNCPPTLLSCLDPVCKPLERTYAGVLRMKKVCGHWWRKKGRARRRCACCLSLNGRALLRAWLSKQPSTHLSGLIVGWSALGVHSSPVLVVLLWEVIRQSLVMTDLELVEIMGIGDWSLMSSISSINFRIWQW